jgi:hypothetical protein
MGYTSMHRKSSRPIIFKDDGSAKGQYEKQERCENKKAPGPLFSRMTAPRKDSAKNKRAVRIKKVRLLQKVSILLYFCVCVLGRSKQLMTEDYHAAAFMD